MSPRARSLIPVLALSTLTIPALLPSSAAAATADESPDSVRVAAGSTWVAPQTTRLRCLTIEGAGGIAAPPGYTLSLTVNGAETGSAFTETASAVTGEGGEYTALAPGTYCGEVVITVSVANDVPWQQFTFPLRQALYVGSTGVVENKTVRAAIQGGRVTNTLARNIEIKSTGEGFNGVYVNDAPYSLVGPNINLRGNGRSDFVGYGAAITANGTNARLVVDDATVRGQGVMRTGVVADGGSNVIVKNSTIATANGQLPDGYVSTVDLAFMQDAPWMLSIKGNNRTTNLLGDNTKATYINSTLRSNGWGVLSTDTGSNGKLTAINSIVNTGTQQGYGAYAIGGAQERFLGTRFDVTAYAAINRGGSIHYGNSTRAAVRSLNQELNLGLTASEINALAAQRTVVNSQRFGVMWHGAGAVSIDGRTVFNTNQATFLDKGQQIDVTFDGSRGARLNPRNGILLQVMEDDDPGPQMVDGVLLNTGVFHEPTTPPTKLDTWDVTVEHDSDAEATFTDATLTGDFYNGMRGGYTGPPGPGAGVEGKNMVLTFDGTRITGVLSATTTRHHVDTITSATYEQLGEVTNTVGPVVNNGVIVKLANGSRWNVTGASYLSSLTVEAGSTLNGTVTVNGTPTTITPGTTYTGTIVVSPRG